MDQPQSLNNPIQFTQYEDVDSDPDDDNKRPPHQGHRLPAVSLTNLGKVRTLEHNDSNPSGWKQVVTYHLAPLGLHYLLESDIPRPTKSDPSSERWSYWSSLVTGWLHNHIDTTLQTKIQCLSKKPRYADRMFEELMNMTQGGDKIRNAFIEIRKFDNWHLSSLAPFLILNNVAVITTCYYGPL
ncbi:hypothetical protein N7535_000589 [Penicillium sp. DV-2018c]|nr:hypothetical protein N7461_006159 [Penicillium sp. DV-2018c]KAJ5581969.1 hypothetical protein N7535_000589 [Penicillium sp. DV-2018c]